MLKTAEIITETREPKAAHILTEDFAGQVNGALHEVARGASLDELANWKKWPLRNPSWTDFMLRLTIVEARILGMTLRGVLRTEDGRNFRLGLPIELLGLRRTQSNKTTQTFFDTALQPDLIGSSESKVDTTILKIRLRERGIIKPARAPKPWRIKF